MKDRRRLGLSNDCPDMSSFRDTDLPEIGRWMDALEAAAGVHCTALVVDTESGVNVLGKAAEVAAAMGAEYMKMETFEAGYDLPVLLKRNKG